MANSPASQVIHHLREALLLHEAGRTDGQLLEDFLSRRDEEAVAALVQRHAPMVWGVCRRLLSHHDAEDAFQATFLVLIRKAASVVPRNMVPNWLHGVAHQTALKARATAAKRQAREGQVTDMPEPTTEGDHGVDLQPLLDEELSRLPDIYRVALVLCDLEGKTRKEAAGQLGVPEGTLAARVARGRAMLARRLAGRGVVPAALMASTINAATLLAAGKAATAVVSAKVAALTEGVLKGMLLSKLKIATGVFVLAGLLIAGGAVGVRARQPLPTAKAVPSPEPPDDTPPWKKEFRKVYGLRGGAVVRRVPPPFPECRMDFFRSEPVFADHVKHPPGFMAYQYDPKAGDLEFRSSGLEHFDVGVRFALVCAGGVPLRDLAGDKGLLDTVIGGDFVYRKGASVEARVADMERILRDECKLAVKLTFREVEQEVIVARGRLGVTPLPGKPKNHIAAYAKVLTKKGSVTTSGRLSDFLEDLSGFVGRRIVNEALDKGERITFRFHVVRPPPEVPALVPPGAVPPGADNEDHLPFPVQDPAVVLPNITRQTGLKFTTEKRKVRLLFVEKSDR